MSSLKPSNKDLRRKSGFGVQSPRYATLRKTYSQLRVEERKDWVRFVWFGGLAGCRRAGRIRLRHGDRSSHGCHNVAVGCSSKQPHHLKVSGVKDGDGFQDK